MLQGNDNSHASPHSFCTLIVGVSAQSELVVRERAPTASCNSSLISRCAFCRSGVNLIVVSAAGEWRGSPLVDGDTRRLMRSCSVGRRGALLRTRRMSRLAFRVIALRSGSFVREPPGFLTGARAWRIIRSRIFTFHISAEPRSTRSVLFRRCAEGSLE